MKNVREWLQAADPLADEPSLADEYAQRMRRRVLTAVDQPVVSPTFWPARLIAAAVAVAVAVTVGVHRSLSSPHDSDAGADAQQAIAAEPPVTTPRQLEFVTAGGTRVIWHFNPDFDIKEPER
jgi:hypothetical protein